MPVAEITRTETAERARLLTVDRYDVRLDLTRGEQTFRSVSVITFGCHEPGATSYVDLVSKAVHEITLNGQVMEPAGLCAEGRIVLTGLAARNELRVVADCSYTGDGSALHRTVDSADGRVYCYTTLFPAEARRVFANFDQPDLKAEFSFHITAPEHWTVLSNQPSPEPEPRRDGSATWHFAPTPRISTYLAAVVAGEYHLVRDSHTTPAGQEIPLAVACRQSLAPYLEAADMISIARQGLDYYTALFRSPFPFAKYDQVIVPEFPAGAMENVGCVTFSEHYVFRSKVTQESYERRAITILHEMAHQWFGDMVTMRWWEDLWLNESFAEFCGIQSAAEVTRFTNAWTTFCAGRKVWGYLQDQQPSTHPIAGDVPTLTEAIANFDGISYAKGGSVLKQLVAYLGRDVFFAGIRAYFSEHGWGNATLADLLRALEASSGRSLAAWSKAWLETAGPNTLRADFADDGDGHFTHFAVLQQAPAEHPTLRPHHIAIGLYTKKDGSLVRTHRVELDVAGPRTTVPELTGQPRPDLIVLNDDDLDYALITFDDFSLHTLSESIGDLTDPLARAVCWSAVLDMALQAEISVPRFVGILTAGMGTESSVPVLQTVLNLTQRLLNRAADPQQLPELQDRLATAASTLLDAAEPGSDHQLAWAELLAAVATMPAQLDLLAGLLDGSRNIAGLAVDTELRWSILRRLATTGRAGDAEIDAELARDATDAGLRHARSCRAAIPDPEHKAAAWALLADTDELGPDGAAEVAIGFGQSEHAELIAPFAEKYFEQMPGIWAARSDMQRMQLGSLLFPYAAASPELLERVDAFLGTHGLDRGLARVVMEGRDVAAKALRARGLPS